MVFNEVQTSPEVVEEAEKNKILLAENDEALELIQSEPIVLVTCSKIKISQRFMYSINIQIFIVHKF